MLITISGLPGSGKTTVGRLIARRLGLPHVYAGDIFRAEARDRGLALAELTALAENDHTIDKALDARMADYARRGGVVLEGRLAAFVALQENADALKVFLTASDGVRAERVAGREGNAVKKVLAENDARQRSDAKRYKEIYGWDLEDTSLYDIRLDSDDRTPEALAEEIVAAATERFPGAAATG